LSRKNLLVIRHTLGYTSLMETLWEAVKRFGISAINEPARAFFTIPDGNALLAADQVHRMLLWIESDSKETVRGILVSSRLARQGRENL